MMVASLGRIPDAISQCTVHRIPVFKGRTEPRCYSLGHGYPDSDGRVTFKGGDGVTADTGTAGVYKGGDIWSLRSM